LVAVRDMSEEIPEEAQVMALARLGERALPEVFGGQSVELGETGVVHERQPIECSTAPRLPTPRRSYGRAAGWSSRRSATSRRWWSRRSRAAPPAPRSTVAAGRTSPPAG